MPNTVTFAGLPACTDFCTTADIAIIGIPHGTPYDPGQAGHSAGAPAAIRQTSGRYASMLGHYDFDFGGALISASRRPGCFAHCA
jgi:agmatinase